MGMLDNLFSSKARIKILELLLFNASDSFYQRQIETLAGLPIQSVQREMKKLEKIGLAEKDTSGNRVYYRVNKNCPIFGDLKRLFIKSRGIAEIFKSKLNKAQGIISAFIYGSYARNIENASSDIDLMVIGEISLRVLSGLLAGPRKQLRREINYSVFGVNEFKKKLKEKDNFILSVFKSKKIFMIGNDGEFKAIVGK